MLLFQFADDVAIITGRKVAFFCNLIRHNFHLTLEFDEGIVRHRDQFFLGNIDAVAFQRQVIFFGRQAEVGACLGQDVGLDPSVVVHQLRLQLAVRLLPVLQVVLLHQRSDPVEISRVARHLGFDFYLRGIDDSRLGHLLGHALLQDFGQRGIAGFESGILADAHYRRGPAVTGRLVVEQSVQAAEHDLARVDVGYFVRALKVLTTKVQAHPADHDLQILGHVLLLLFCRRRFQLFEDRRGFLALFVFVGQCRLRDLGVELAQPLLRRLLGMKFEGNLDQHVRVLIAGRNPTLFVGRSRRGLRGRGLGLRKGTNSEKSKEREQGKFADHATSRSRHIKVVNHACTLGAISGTHCDHGRGYCPI